MLHRPIAVVVLVVLSLFALPAFAQDGKSDDEASTPRVVILKFETFNAEQSVMDEFYSALHEAVESHPQMRVGPGGDMSINDLTLTLGCESADVTCLNSLNDLVDGERIVFGSVQHSEGVYLFSLNMFDFEQGVFTREVSDETIEGDSEAIKQGIQAVIDGFLYGDVGRLDVAATGAGEADILFDGEQVGTAPMMLDELPLGEHVVTVETSDGQKQSRKVMLHRGKVSRVQFDFDRVEEPSGAPAVSKGYAIPGWAAAGVGTVGLVAGVIGTMQVDSYNSEAESMVCGTALCSSSSTTRANKLQDDMDSAYTMSIVGYSVAAVGLAAGGYLLYQAYSGTGAESAPPADGFADADDSPEVNFGIAPNAGGASVGVHVGF